MDPSRWQNLGYLFWAYTLFWSLLAGYLVILALRLRRLERDLQAILRRGDRARAPGPPPDAGVSTTNTRTGPITSPGG